MRSTVEARKLELVDVRMYLFFVLFFCLSLSLHIQTYINIHVYMCVHIYVNNKLKKIQEKCI